MRVPSNVILLAISLAWLPYRSQGQIRDCRTDSPKIFLDRSRGWNEPYPIQQAIEKISIVSDTLNIDITNGVFDIKEGKFSEMQNEIQKVINKRKAGAITINIIIDSSRINVNSESISKDFRRLQDSLYSNLIKHNPYKNYFISALLISYKNNISFSFTNNKISYIVIDSWTLMGKKE